jgi:hypothetical protein
MRRPIFVLSLIGGFLCSASGAFAQRVCVLAPNNEIVCGPIVQRGPQPQYAPPPPPEPYDEPEPYVGERRFHDDRHFDEQLGNRSPGPPPPHTLPAHPAPAHPPIHCQPGFTVQGGVCKPGH